MNELLAKVRNWYKQRPAWFIGGALLLLSIVFFAVLQNSPSDNARQSRLAAINQVKLDYGITQPLPEQVELNAEKVALGERLFRDPRLSGNDTVSCASCHNLQLGGVDGLAHSVGINGGLSAVNAPTVFNSGFNFVQFWDGRAATLEEQIDGPVNNPKEMGSNWQQVIGKLNQDKTYLTQFRHLYSVGISPGNIKDAIATFERSLITPNSRFDQFLRGNKAALSEQAQNGFVLFQSYGCASCHQGINLGGNMFEKMGLLGDYFADRGNETEADIGRFQVTRNPEHMHEFKVPSLRNVARTAPYFHDGNAQTLQQAVATMARYQLGRNLTSDEIADICAFLESLTGEYQGKSL
ncbi:MAG: cytochrome-c peroxidase [Gallionellaceae bacterium]